MKRNTQFSLVKWVIAPNVWLVIAIIMGIQFLMNIVISAASRKSNSGISINLWSIGVVAGFVSLGIYSVSQLGTWLATGRTRREVARAGIVGIIGYALAFSVASFALMAAETYWIHGAQTVWNVRDSLLPIGWLAFAFILLTTALGMAAGPWAFGGFLRFHWLIACCWTLLVAVLPLGLAISGFVIQLMAQGGALSDPFWVGIYAPTARWLAGLALVIELAALPRFLGGLRAPRAAAA